METVKELEKEFIGKGEVRGKKFVQLMCNDKAYLYAVDDTHYEVFERRENSWFNCISYPHSESFGLWAWTYKTHESAFKKFAEITNA